MEIEEIVDAKSLRTYLEGVSTGTACVLATRAALRVIPFLIDVGTDHEEKWPADFIVLNLLLEAIRVMAPWQDVPISFLGGEFQTIQQSTYARADSAYRSGISSLRSFNATKSLEQAVRAKEIYSSSIVLVAQDRGLDNVKNEANLSVRDAAQSFAINHQFEFWDAVRSDLTDMGGGNQLNELMQKPLWHGQEIPQEARQAWEKFKDKFLKLDENWRFIFVWYEKALVGGTLLNDSDELQFFPRPRSTTRGTAASLQKIAEACEGSIYDPDPRGVHRGVKGPSNPPVNKPNEEQDRLVSRVNFLLQTPDLNAMTAKVVSAQIKQAVDAYCNDTGENESPGVVQAFERVAIVINNLQATPASQNNEQEIADYQKRIQELESEVQRLSLALSQTSDPSAVQKMKEGFFFTLGAAPATALIGAAYHFIGPAFAETSIGLSVELNRFVDVNTNLNLPQ